jgi:hypothetical protein
VAHKSWEKVPGGDGHFDSWAFLIIYYAGGNNEKDN